MKVKATQKGYYGKFRYPGDEFTIKAKEDFSKAWMVEVKPEKPEKPESKEDSKKDATPKVKAS